MTNEPRPYFTPLGPPRGTNLIPPGEEHAAAAAAAREASEKEMAYLRALGRPRLPKPELPAVRQPVLTDNFEQQVAELDDTIHKRGVAMNADKLFQLGKERFALLLEIDRKAPRSSIGSGVDLTRFESVAYALQAFEAPSVPVRTMMEQASGSGKERDQVRRISGFDDLWKATQERREVIDDIYSFRDLFESLCFGQSMLARLSKDGRLRSHFFCGGKGEKVDYFTDWLTATGGTSLVSVKLVQPLWHLLGWLAQEKAPAPDPVALAHEFLGTRAPREAQVKLMEALLHGFLLGYDGWPLWEFVGRRIRTVPDMNQLSAWRTALARRYLSISSFDAESRAAFNRDVGYGGDFHRQFEPTRYRAFIDATVQQVLDCLSAVLALALEQTFPGTVVARFQNSVLCKGKPKQRAEITAHLAKAFPSATFPLEFVEVQS